MSKSTKRGRPSKDANDSTYTIIKDSLMEPYYIQKDRYNYTVIKKETPTRGFAGKKAVGKEIEKHIAYFTTFKSALWKISKLKFSNETKGEYDSIKEYMDEWNNIKNGIDSLLNKIPNEQ